MAMAAAWEGATLVPADCSCSGLAYDSVILKCGAKIDRKFLRRP